MPALKHWIYADDGIPAWQTAIGSKSAFVAGCAGILKPVRPLSFPAVTGTDLIRRNRPCFPGNTVFTHWVEMLITAPDLTPSCCQQIHQWYQMWLSEGGVYHSWDSLTATQKARLSPLLSGSSFDWLNRFTGEDEAGLAAVWEDIQYLRGREVRRQQRSCVLCLRVSAVRSVMSMLKKAVVSTDTASMTMAG